VGIADIVSTAGRSSAVAWIRPLVLSPSLLQNFDNLLWVDYHAFAVEEYPNLPPYRLIHDGRYLGFDNLAGVEFDADSRAYAVFHAWKYTRSPIRLRRPRRSCGASARSRITRKDYAAVTDSRVSSHFLASSAVAIRK
jgi:hypothetical protein